MVIASSDCLAKKGGGLNHTQAVSWMAVYRWWMVTFITSSSNWIEGLSWNRKFGFSLTGFISHRDSGDEVFLNKVSISRSLPESEAEYVGRLIVLQLWDLLHLWMLIFFFQIAFAVCDFVWGWWPDCSLATFSSAWVVVISQEIVLGYASWSYFDCWCNWFLVICSWHQERLSKHIDRLNSVAPNSVDPARSRKSLLVRV